MRGKCRCKILLFCFGILFLSGILSIQTDANELQEKTIRVGYPIAQGLTMRDEYGNLSGYSYDYLMEISQYTGWNYEFVFTEGSLDGQLTSLMEMLKKGEIDILGAMYYDESLTDVYSYPGYCYGINYSGLFVPEQSKLRESSLYNFKDIRVGVHNKKKEKNQLLDQYAQMNNINIEQVITDSSSDFYDMIEDGRADALMSTDISMASRKNMFAVAHFSPKPFYFITTKGNTDVIRKLDYAISTIDQVNPNYMVQLSNKYFSKSSSEIILSDEEKRYLEANDTLEVVMYDNKPPFQYIDSITGKPAGITVEVLDLIAANLGISFHYNTVSTYQDYITTIKENKADIAADMLINFQDAKETESLLTLPWCELPISVMFHETESFDENGVAAIPYFLKNTVVPGENAVYYDSVEDSLKAVQKGEADFCYIGDFCGQYFSNNAAYSNLKKHSNSGVATQKLSFGICDSTNLELLMIFNKVIPTLSSETINQITYQQTYKQPPITLTTYLKQNRNLLITVVMALVTILLIILYYIKNRHQYRISFENKRYDAISNLANEYFYEYNVTKDELILSEKCANYFGCDHKIPNFSGQLSRKQEEENTGIWQIGEYIIHNSESSIELSCEMPDHSRQWFKIFSSSIENKKKQIYAVGKITDIQEIKTEQIRLEQQATIDSLTGIYNIATIKDMIKRYLEQIDLSVPCALLIMDIDNFKKINDTFGHQKGDSVLTQTARLITSAFPDGLAGRLGGDEFIVFVKESECAELEENCRLLCKGMTKKTYEMLGMSFSLSIGITMMEKGKSYDILYHEADSALYKTKEMSKNGFSFYEN